MNAHLTRFSARSLTVIALLTLLLAMSMQLARPASSQAAEGVLVDQGWFGYNIATYCTYLWFQSPYGQACEATQCAYARAGAYWRRGYFNNSVRKFFPSGDGQWTYQHGFYRGSRC